MSSTDTMFGIVVTVLASQFDAIYGINRHSVCALNS